ncbi:hypothetical protein PG985_008013 [Apiospora marii]|uniref:Uncharacterized protein n=1 Tax=Apiospora marii TaxID=335849 RepID=A0ABR1R9A8_9PEZI
MAGRPIGLDQVKTLILEDKWAQIIHMTKQGRISRQDFVDAAVATKSPEFLAKMLCDFMSLRGFELLGELGLLPRTNEVENNKPHDKNSQEKEPQDRKTQDGKN